ncbi:MAG: D-inositol-3-phosphate glycosyltransferase [Chlamydiae bacterium]|nr:D-inositol-3-phosphate glycosyltransferase [Chlamydiota bacterium]
MKVLFDSSVMALAILENVAMHKTGIFRYAENLATHLLEMTDVELGFYSTLGRRDKNLWKKKLDELGHLKGIPLLNHYHPLKRQMDGLKQKIMDASPMKKLFLKSLCESLRMVMKSSPNLVGKVGAQDIYFSPYHPIPKLIREKKDLICFTMIHDLIPLKYPNFFKVDKRGFFDSIFKKAKPNHFFIAASETTKADICHYYSINPSKITVAYGAPQRDIFYPVEDEALLKSTLQRYNIQKPYILSLATVEPRKNILALVDAYIEIIQQNPNLELDLVLCGAKGWGMEALKEKITPYKDRILITGYAKDEDLASIYSGATAFVYPSLYEGFGIPPVEAMCCNTPVIVSDRASLPEVVGSAGLYVDPTDIKDMASQMLKVVQDVDLQNQLKEKGLERVKKFTWENTAKTIHQAFEASLDQVG